MEGGTAGEFVSFQDDDIGLTPQGQVVGDGCAGNAAADDDNPCVSGKLIHQLYFFRFSAISPKRSPCSSGNTEFHFFKPQVLKSKSIAEMASWTEAHITQPKRAMTDQAMAR